MINVLIVEDDPMVAELNRNYLGLMSGFRLAGIVGNGHAALDFLQHNPVSLLLLDVFMPQLDGLSLLQEVRKNHPNVDVIMVTAARSSQDIQTALRYGVIDYIVKPFVFERLQAALLSYQQRVRLLSVDTELSQSMIDGRIFTKESQSQTMPKGIESETLKRVRSAAQQYSGAFSVSDLSTVVGLSRISLKKYLDHLQDINVLQSELVYRSMGRPVKLYRYFQ